MTVPGPVRVLAGGVERDFDGAGPITLGRDPSCDVVVRSPKASRLHARLIVDPHDGWTFEDAGSSNGSFVGGRPVRRAPVGSGLTVRLGHPESGDEVVLGPTGGSEDRTAPGAGQGRSGRRVSGVMTLGRAPSNDVVINDLQVSRHHAEVRRDLSGRVWVVDGDSHNGTFVNGRRIVREALREGDVVGVGRHSFEFRGGVLTECVDEGRVRFEASGLTYRTLSGQTILDDVSFGLDPSSLLAVVGPAGAGKSTLMKALAGTQPATAGRVFYDGADLYRCYDQLRTRVGYVPQEDIVHPQLTLRSALQFAADLRFPADTAQGERSRRVDEVLGELGLRDRADLQVAKLSGGQRKRTNVALELLTAPSLLLLDEPTTGLDPGLVKSLMELFRQLADGGRTVIVITHSLQSIELSDLVLVLSTGGRTAFLGPPPELLPYFGRTDSADVFQDLERGDIDWPARFRTHPFHRRYVRDAVAAHEAPAGKAPARTIPQRPLQPWHIQLRTLARRQLAVLTADWRNFVYLALGVLLPGSALLALIDRRALTPATAPQTDARVLLLALVVAATCIGAANGLREIVKERPIFRRDRAAGMSVGAYLGSKLAVLGAVTVVQVVLLVAIGTGSSGAPLGTRGIIMVSFALAALGALALGLLLSAVVGSSEKAMALIAVVFVGQWLFSGAAVDLHGKPPLQVLGYATSANWGLAAAASGSELYRLEQRCLPGQPVPPGYVGDPPTCDARWRPTGTALALNLAALPVLIAITTAAALAGLDRKEIRRVRPARR